MIVSECGDANPKGNIAFTFKGGCLKEVFIKEAYRCTGCGGWFHKQCILKHFELEKEHDFGRNEERKLLSEKLRKVADKLLTTLGSMPAHEADQLVLNLANLIYTDMLGLKGEIKIVQQVSVRIAGKCEDMSTYRFIEQKGGDING